MEGYLAPGSRHERKRATLGGQVVSDDNPGQMYTHMTLLAENTEGMHNLFRLSSLASLEGYYYKPRMDRELLETYGKGIIATTGCPSGEVARCLQQDDFDGACQAASDYRDIFGEENFFCELMDHGIEIERRVRDDLYDLKKKLDLPGLATNDLHYTYAKDAKPHEVLLCVQTGKTMNDPNRFRFDAQDFYLKSAQRDARPVGRRLPRGVRQHPGHRRAGARRVHRGPRPAAGGAGARGRDRGLAGWSRRSSGGCTGGSRTASRRTTASRPSTRSRSSCRWATRATSW